MSDQPQPLDAGSTLRNLEPNHLVFSRYALRRRLSQMPGTELWLAHDHELGRDVALKFLPSSLLDDPAALERFKVAGRRALELTHPTIIRLYDLILAEGKAALSMEYFPSASLSELRRERAEQVFTQEELRPILAQVCEALNFAHLQRGLAHGGLSADKILVSQSGEVKLLGFGLSSCGASSEPLDDIYALGLLAYEVLTGTVPYSLRASKPAEALSDSSPVPLPHAWEETILSCLARKPSLRPQSALEFSRLLALSALGTRAAPRVSLSSPPAPVLAPAPVSVPVSGPRSAPVAASASTRFPKKQVFWLCLAFALGLGLLGLWYGSGQRVRTADQVVSPRDSVSSPQEPAASSPTALLPERPRAGEAWEIPELGMKFVPVPGTQVLFSIWKTRVQDFQVFVMESNLDATIRVSSCRDAVWGLYGDSWDSPGFRQGPTHPVVGVSFFDSLNFCEWLTKRERAAGRLSEKQCYRPPTDTEWNAAVGTGVFPWGNQWPPRVGSGNFCDKSIRTTQIMGEQAKTLPGYDDSYAGTSPVDFYAPNALGIHDLAGNALEWVADRSGGLRGSTYLSLEQESMKSSFFSSYPAKTRRLDVGFRVVCEVGSVKPKQ